jgi:hypothetical protein
MDKKKIDTKHLNKSCMISRVLMTHFVAVNSTIGGVEVAFTDIVAADGNFRNGIRIGQLNTS